MHMVGKDPHTPPKVRNQGVPWTPIPRFLGSREPRNGRNLLQNRRKAPKMGFSALSVCFDEVFLPKAPGPGLIAQDLYEVTTSNS